MKLKKSLVSVIIPIYNAEKFLSGCLDSILKQSHSEIEIIAIDDLSTDNSVKILKNYKRRSSKIKILQNKKHYGPSICLNRGLKISQGQYLAIINPNDSVSPHRFKKQINYLINHAKTVAVGSQYITIDENNTIIEKSSLPQEHETIYPKLLPAVSFKPETILINRHLLPKDLIHFTTNKYPFIYTEIIIKLLQYGKIANLNHTLYIHRQGMIRYVRRKSKVKRTFSLMSLFLKTRATYDYRPSLLSFLPSIFRHA